jgi:hypothetical protein
VNLIPFARLKDFFWRNLGTVQTVGVKSDALQS